MHKCYLHNKSYITEAHVKRGCIASKLIEAQNQKHKDLIAWYKFRMVVNQVSVENRIPFYKAIDLLRDSTQYKKLSLDTFLDCQYGLSEWHRVIVIRAHRRSLKRSGQVTVPVTNAVEPTPQSMLDQIKRFLFEY